MRKRTAALVAGSLAATVGLATVGITAVADQVILDDLIVDGSACVGQDCVNGESFGFDTIRLKENNLRIKFQDTSSTSSFPSNDWQLTANDSTNGGLNKFSIDDITGGRTPFTVEAGAASHSLYVDDGGRLGLGTNNPAVDIHNVSGNTPTLRLAQDGSSGFTAQTWDVAGNEAGFFVRDATNGSTLPFRIRPGAPSSAIDVAATGNVSITQNLGVGTGATGVPEADLDVSNAGPVTMQLTDRTANVDWKFATTANGQLVVSRVNSGVLSEFLRVRANGAIVLTGNVAVNGALNVTGNVTCTVGSNINGVACS